MFKPFYKMGHILKVTQNSKKISSQTGLSNSRGWAGYVLTSKFWWTKSIQYLLFAHLHLKCFRCLCTVPIFQFGTYVIAILNSPIQTLLWSRVAAVVTAAVFFGAAAAVTYVRNSVRLLYFPCRLLFYISNVRNVNPFSYISTINKDANYICTYVYLE